MKQDRLLQAVLSFLLPLILIFGCFNFAEFFLEGIFAGFFFAIILFICAFLLYFLGFSNFEKITKLKSFVKIKTLILLGLLIFFCKLLVEITGWFSV